MSETFSVQLTAVATAALAIFALATAVLAFMAWRKQSREVHDQAEMLKLQAEEFRQLSQDRGREAQERRRAQAVQVYLQDGVRVATVRNTSQQPVYQLRVYWLTQPGGSSLLVGPLMPGEEHKTHTDLAVTDPRQPFSCTAFFRDHAGAWWQMWPDGRLEEVDETAPGKVVPWEPPSPYVVDWRDFP